MLLKCGNDTLNRLIHVRTFLVKNPENLDSEPLIPASTSLPEFTFKAIVLSILLAIVLSAANAYLALKIGTTISASIPASVLALGILRFFKQHNVLESNLVQTAASAGEGVAAALAYVLPAMIFLRIWNGFPYWETLIIAVLGGLLGVLFAAILRRVMLNLPVLRFPEGTAIGNLLKISVKGKGGLKLLANGGVVGGIIAFAQTGLKIVSDNLQLWTFTGKTVFGFGWGFTPAVLASGYIVGFEVAVSFLIGVTLGWVIILPLIGLYYGLPANATSAYDAATQLWDAHLRFVGVGTMLVGGLWTLLNLLKPIIKGVHLSFVNFRKKLGETSGQRLRIEADIPPVWIIVGVLALIGFSFFYIFYYFREANFLGSGNFLAFVAFVSIIYILVVGFLLATISSYVCGLVGSSNNPLSGLLITAILLLAFLFLLIFHVHGSVQAHRVASAVIIIATVLAGIGSIAGENIQDLKAGRMVGATPWRQQVMMGVGVIVSALIIGPVLQLLFNAYGMGGVYPRPGMDPSQMLAAPQSALMAAVARGVLTRHLNWDMVIVGAFVAVIIIILDEFLKRRNFRVPALAVGLAIYLPPEVIMPVVVGGMISLLVKKPSQRKRRSAEQEQELVHSHQRGVLMACGMVAGSALMGVILAIPFVIMGTANALSIVTPRFAPIADVLGVIVFLALCAWFYYVGRKR
ncbi:OPT family oligopeptide transporter [Coxiella burnetii]|uniref:Oligopeptide transporter n=1 Tax=Coxiella burnetii (strain RSA 493 / Nine Mile phase I) TaxID=227377 RepID=Q83CI5_COXBU|nr:oligopeptide transporter, OPT family [Coxiella burnetii]NP_820129.2 oligopeptide transporter [Coxiella burnetii RSA 493]AAO90643.2 oligopeptide transporter [Coxiella burnetii RSA 493]ARI65936.1 oligopeptide transporter, OPT family [Coxiella burnetii]ATN82225.1 peptide transporter [Coxiella burnetii]ATN84127.1 peptide transporter [Coxiella burnetii]AZV76015.1 oligopeptide transporter, OPT family [Coxiella burnetii]